MWGTHLSLWLGIEILFVHPLHELLDLVFCPNPTVCNWYFNKVHIASDGFEPS